LRQYSDPVLVLGGSLSGLGVLRTFGRHGIDAYLVADRKEPAVFSKYCKRSFNVSGKRFDREILKKLLKRIGRMLSKPIVVYPTTDLDALNLAEIKDDLAEDFHFVVGDKAPVETLVNKTKFYRALDRSGIHHPMTHFPENMKDVQRIAVEISYPIFVRPAITQIMSQNLHTSAKGFVAHSPRELQQYFQFATSHNVEVMFQEIIPGPPESSCQLEGYYDMSFRPVALFARRRLRIWPPDFGNTTLCVSIPVTELADEKIVINRFLCEIGYHGLASAEFKKDSRDGRQKIFEINARPWWHFWLSSKCGVDLVFLSYLDAIGEKSDYIEEYEVGVKSTYFLNDLLASASMLRDRSLRFGEWFRSLRGIRQFAFFSPDDVSPFVMEFANQTRLLFQERLHPLIQERKKLDLPS
jgi:predicted ATP-grasp superfamily ATP-dependent carboligase